MRLGIMLGFLIGGIAAVILKQADANDPGPFGAIKRQFREAALAAKEEAAEKEAELMAEYEAARHGERPATSP